MNPRPILDLVIRHESLGAVQAQRVLSAYDVVHNLIEPADRPPVPLTTLTVGEVLAWQDRIDSRYRSEAAGAFQVLEDTLRGLGLDHAMLFDVAGQDACAMRLLARRGWHRLVAGEILPERFGDQLAREWASLPVHSDQRGGSRWVKRGQSYYAGDGLNRAYATPAEVMAAITAAMATPAPCPAHTWLAEAPTGAVEWLRAIPDPRTVR